MKKLIIACLLAIAAAVAQPSARAAGPVEMSLDDGKEPTYKGKTISAWIALTKDSDAVVRERAAMALGYIGDERPEKRVIRALAGLLKDKESSVRRTAAGTFWNLHTRAGFAVPQITELLKDNNAGVRADAADALANIGPAARTAIPILIDLLKDKDGEVQAAATYALGNIGAEAKAAIPAITQFLKGKDQSLWVTAAHTLEHFGADAKEAIPALATLLREEDRTVRWSASSALSHIGPAAIPALIVSLEDKSALARAGAASALQEIGPPASTAIPALTELLKDKDAAVRQAAASALVTCYDSGAKAGLPVFLKLRNDNDAGVREAAARWLGSFHSDAKSVVPALVELLKDKDWTVRAAAAYSLGHFGSNAKSAIPSLTSLLDDDDSYVRRTAASALSNIDRSPATIPAFLRLFKDKDGQVREAAAEAVGLKGPASVPILAELLNDKDKNVRQAAACAIAYIGPDAKVTVPRLTKLLESGDPSVGKDVVHALYRIGPDATMAIPEFIKLLKDDRKHVRSAAAGALEAINRLPPSGGFGIGAKFEDTDPILPSTPIDQRWVIVWHDEFDGAKLDEKKWTVPPDAPRKGGWWMRKAVALDGEGHLVISTLREGEKLIDGSINTKGKFEHAFGYDVARVKFQQQPGHWSAFWINGRGIGKVGSGGREGTEIDIMEKPWRDDRVQHTLHWDGYGKDHKSLGKVAQVPGVMEGWHTFGLRWRPDEYIFYVDGKETWRTKASGVCQVPEYILLSDEIGKWAGDIKQATLPDRFMVDYVRVYDTVEKW